MTLRDWLTNYIRDAFHGVKLEDGVDIYTARYQDSYGNDEEEHLLSLCCQRGNWEQIDPQILRDRAWVLTFLDAKGFRFYLPAMMIDIVRHEKESDLAETLFYRFSVTPDGRFDGNPFCDTFSRFQRAAIVRFLKYLRHNAGWTEDSAAQKLFDRIKHRT